MDPQSSPFITHQYSSFHSFIPSYLKVSQSGNKPSKSFLLEPEVRRGQAVQALGFRATTLGRTLEYLEIFPNGCDRGPYILIFFKGFEGPTQNLLTIPS